MMKDLCVHVETPDVKFDSISMNSHFLSSLDLGQVT